MRASRGTVGCPSRCVEAQTAVIAVSLRANRHHATAGDANGAQSALNRRVCGCQFQRLLERRTARYSSALPQGARTPFAEARPPTACVPYLSAALCRAEDCAGAISTESLRAAQRRTEAAVRQSLQGRPQRPSPGGMIDVDPFEAVDGVRSERGPGTRDRTRGTRRADPAHGPGASRAERS